MGDIKKTNKYDPFWNVDDELAKAQSDYPLYPETGSHRDDHVCARPFCPRCESVDLDEEALKEAFAAVRSLGVRSNIEPYTHFLSAYLAVANKKDKAFTKEVIKVSVDLAVSQTRAVTLAKVREIIRTTRGTSWPDVLSRLLAALDAMEDKTP